MIRTTIAAAVLAASSAHAAPIPEEFNGIHATLRSNFTPVEQSPRHDRIRVVRGDSPFEGDCDDYALAASWQLAQAGFAPWLVIVTEKYKGGHHVLTCAEGWCFDSYQRSLVSRRSLRDRYTAVLREEPVPARLLKLTEEN